MRMYYCFPRTRKSVVDDTRNYLVMVAHREERVIYVFLSILFSFITDHHSLYDINFNRA